MRRWVQYNVPAFVLVDCSESDQRSQSEGRVRMVILATEADDIHLARDADGWRIYDETLNRVKDGPEIEAEVMSVAEQRHDWPDQETWPAA